MENKQHIQVVFVKQIKNGTALHSKMKYFQYKEMTVKNASCLRNDKYTLLCVVLQQYPHFMTNKFSLIFKDLF